MRILFIPNDLNGGTDNLSRCRALAQFATKSGHDCTIVIHQKQHRMVISEDIKHSYISPFNPVQRMVQPSFPPSNHRSFFVTISNRNYQIVKDNLIHPKSIHKMLGQYADIVHKFRPHIIINDGNLIGTITAKRFRLPLVQIAHASYYPVRPQIIWWEPIPLELRAPDIRHLFNPILESLKLHPIESAEELLEGNMGLIPSIPGLAPADLSSDTYYVGPLLPIHNSSTDLDWRRVGDQKHIYVSMGHNRPPFEVQPFLDTLVATYGNQEVSVLVKVPDYVNIKRLKVTAPNIIFRKGISDRVAIHASDIVVFHGNYTPMMETVLAGKPSIVIPFHSEQESNGRYLQRAGIGRICKLSTGQEELVIKHWKYGAYSYFIHRNYNLTVDRLRDLTNDLLTDDSYYQNCYRLQQECYQLEGAKTAFKVISKELGANYNVKSRRKTTPKQEPETDNQA
ncbi:hypothetical protein JW960_26395 [candidate division KSB1 bacterium]|nr:hypothetical protein [candidate division KSB1 bacterium]